MCKIFFLIQSKKKKTCRQRKLRQTKCLLFNFIIQKLTKTPILPNCQVPNDFFGITVNVISKKFSLVTGFFEATRENIFTYSRPKGLFLAFTLHPTRCQYPLINYLGFHRISRQMGGMATRIQFLGIQREHS